MNSNGPKSFKQFQFPPSRGSQNAVYAPLVVPPPRTITQIEAQQRADQLQLMKAFINAETCMVCGARLDGSIGYDHATVYCCCGGEDEYRAHYKYGLQLPSASVATYYTTHHGFEIASKHVIDDMFNNTIYQLDLTLGKKFQQRQKKMLFTYEGARLCLPKGLNEEEIISKINLYTLFS